MEILVAVIGFAGAILAGFATGALIKRLRDEPEGWLIGWVVAGVALCLSLAVIGIGSLMGFGAVTFRIYQVTGSLLAPLWLAVGMIQLLAERVPPRFLAWLMGIALTIVTGAIMIFDPLKSQDMSKSVPAGAAFWGIVPGYLLIGVHAIAVVIMLAMLVVAALKWRNGDEYDTDNLHASLVIAPSGIALVGAMRFTVPPLFTAALLAVAAAAIWYTVLRPLAPYDDEDEDDFPDRDAPARHGQGAAARHGHDAPGRHGDVKRPLPPEDHDRTVPRGRRAMPEPVPAADLPPAAPRRATGLGDLVAEYRAGEREVDYAARMAPPPEDGPATGYIMNGPSGAHGLNGPSGPHGIQGPHGTQGPHGIQGPHGTPGAHASQGLGGPSGPQRLGGPSGPQRLGGPSGPQGTPRPEYAMPPTPPPPGPATGMLFSGADLFSPSQQNQQGQQSQPQPGGGGGRPSPSIYGLLTVFTIMDGAGEAFDRLAESTVEAVRRGEPDTLVYACHAVKSAPLQRIVYELYRDEVAYRDHQRQPHVERFVNERQSMVLATNVIELNVNAAKVVPLPTVMY
ncbi:antibiotic biosynthesis monooxygenase [Actinomadura sp. ATCC 31491]|uniref:Antibiotic biosynthesis monooxygenase n=1 Tax=Actinomadura luzonensis TaxID=2805427 RepID=A0ABT0FR38_9ACTN|nr:antibiotic biosynthesis monooxygenase [Actinomadura luzonensis]MCK2214638.1 antibiotic biosynthesis monooxygenase [Actinomadura luzonensis]